MTVTAAAMQVAGETIFVSVVGAMAHDCLGAEKAVTLVCTRP
jgi:hypothetical protein